MFNAGTLKTISHEGIFKYGGRIKVIDTQGYKDPQNRDHENSV